MKRKPDAVGVVEEMARFPYKFRDGKVCEKLGKDGRCTIYETRPDVCNVEMMFDKYGSKEMTKAEYFKMNSTICNDLIVKHNRGENYLIDLKQYE